MGTGLEGNCAGLLHPLCLSRAEALPFSDSWQCCPAPGKPTTPGDRKFFKRMPVRSSLAGSRNCEAGLENRACKRCPRWRKGKGGEQGSGVSREGLTPSPGGVGAGLGAESWGWHSLLQGWFLSVSLKGAIGQTTALPHVLSIWPHEFCSVGQLVPKGQRDPPCSSTSKLQRVKVGNRKRNCVQMWRITKKGEKTMSGTANNQNPG